MYDIIRNNINKPNSEKEKGRFMKQKSFKSFSLMDVCRNVQFIVSDTIQWVLKIQTHRIWLGKIAICKRGRQQIRYGENVNQHMPANGFRAEYMGRL